MQPGQQKITQFDEVTSTQSGDIIPIVRGGQNKKISVENFTGVLPEGWFSPAEAWTFASYNPLSKVGVISVPEGSLARYPIGTRVWFKQGTPAPTDRYGYVIASTTTSITLIMAVGSDLSNLTIQQPAISQLAAPQTPNGADLSVIDTGWIQPTLLNGFSSSGSSAQVSYRRIGNAVYFRGWPTKSSLTTDNIFVLPPAYRPAEEKVITVPGSALNYTKISIKPDGGVGMAALPAGGNYVSLAPVSYPVDQ